MTETMTRLAADLVVVGGGMAGVSAAAYAARAGMTVGLIEKARHVGGSALLSGGKFWTARTPADMARAVPGGDPALAWVLIDGFAAAVAWIRLERVPIGDVMVMDARVGYPSIGHQLDVVSYFAHCRNVIEAAGGWIAVDATVQCLILDGGRVAGVVVADRDGRAEVRAPSTLLATGGFQADPELRKTYICPAGDTVLVRSNPASAGDGLRLGLQAGADIAGRMDMFYGHLIASPLARPFLPRDYVALSQVSSPRSLLIDYGGQRFTDESAGYYRNAQQLCQIPGNRALMIGDNAVRAADQRSSASTGSAQIDRVHAAMSAGAHACEAPTVEALESAARAWGFHGAAAAVRRYNSDLEHRPGRMHPPRAQYRHPLVEPPFFAIEVQPAVTFTMGGLRISPDARVLRKDGGTIPGLLAAGADVGGLYDGGYAGGLSMAAVFGLAAARTAITASRARPAGGLPCSALASKPCISGSSPHPAPTSAG
jgi:succinate dehydrogenase/fumarate reductase flavoprotein subunit